MQKITVLAHDPGSKSHGYAVVQGIRQGKRVKFRILVAGHVLSTIRQMKIGPLHCDQVEAYKKELREVQKKYKPDYFVAERYMTRGIRGTIIEVISGMIHTAAATLKIPYTFLAAVTWKRLLERCGVDLKTAYKWCRATPHQLDAVMMGVFALMKIFKVEKQEFDMKKIILALEKVSKEPLTNRVLRRKKK